MTTNNYNNNNNNKELEKQKEEEEEKERWIFSSPIIKEIKKKGGKYLMSESEYLSQFPSTPSSSFSPLFLPLLHKRRKTESSDVEIDFYDLINNLIKETD